MNEELFRLLGVNPEQARQEALNRGILGGILNLAAMSGPQARPIGTAQGLAQAVLGGMEGYQSSFDRTLKEALTGLQVRDIQRKAAEQEASRQAMKRVSERMSPITPEVALGIPGGQAGPTQERAELIGQRRPVTSEELLRLAFTENISPDLQKSLLTAAQLAAPKREETFRPMTDQEKKAYGLPADRAYQVSSTGKIDEVGKGPLVQVLGEGQKGLDNEMKIRGAFSGEPVYKAFQEMRSAYGQITDSLRQASPAGDLAAATKFMKLLDPGSVVRESELYMAMQASGALDRLVNYAEMRIKGTKLTPEQRVDFQTLANQLFSTAAGSFNQKRSEYADLATSYGLNPDRAVGAPAVIPTPGQARTNSLIDQARAELARRQGQR